MKLKKFTGLLLTFVMSLTCVTTGLAEPAEVFEAAETEETEAPEAEAELEDSAESGSAVAVQTEEITQADLADTVTYAVTGGNLTINTSTGAVTDCDTSVTAAEIPSSYSGVSITSIGTSAFRSCSSLKSVTIPSTITSIGNHAFNGCTNLQTVTIPSSVTSLGDYVFYNCSNLTTVTNYAGITEIPYCGFENCIRLSTVNIPSTVTSLSSYAFKGCTLLPNITLPDGLTSIGYEAFRNCTRLTTISIPSSVTEISNGAFRSCTAMTSFTIRTGGSNKTIGSYAFYECTALTSASLPSTVTSLGDYVFYNCTALTSLSLNEGLTNIGYCDFENCTSLASASIPSTVTSIDSYAFKGCTNLSHLGLQEGLLTIGYEAFRNCTSITSVIIPDSVTEIGRGSFRSCSSLSSLTITSGSTGKTIGSYAFYECTALPSVSLPSTVTSLGDYVFYNCTALTTLSLSEGLTNIGYCDFENCSKISSVTIPSTVTSIDSYAFKSCTGMTSLTIKEGVNSIGYEAFRYCSGITSVSIPDSMNSISNNAFRNCTSLKTFTVYSEVASIGSNILTDCSALTTVYCYKGSTADDSSLYPSGVTISYMAAPVIAPSFEVVGVFGGRNVTFASNTAGAVIYYSSDSYVLTTDDAMVSNGETVLFEDFYGTIYARAYYNGTWSDVSRLILKIPVTASPEITVNGSSVTIASGTPSSFICYTTDGTEPVVDNDGTAVNGTWIRKDGARVNSGTITVDPGVTVKAIAVRNCFTNSVSASAYVPVGSPQFTVVGAYGGRNVTFTSSTEGAVIYYSADSYILSTNDTKVSNGETILFEDFYGTIYARAYYNGVWSDVSRLILKIPVVEAPEVTYEGNVVRLVSSTKDSFICYTTDGTDPVVKPDGTVTNGTWIKVNGARTTKGSITVSSGTTVKAISIRNCFTNSSIVSCTVS